MNHLPSILFAALIAACPAVAQTTNSALGPASQCLISDKSHYPGVILKDFSPEEPALSEVEGISRGPP